MKKMSKSTITILIIVVAIIIITGVVVYLVIDHYKEMQEDAVALELNNDLKVEFLSKKKVSDFIKNLQGTLVDDYEFEANKVGTNTITFNYKSIRNKDKTKSFEIEVIDTVAPLVVIEDPITVVKGQDVDLIKTVFCGDDSDPNPTKEVLGEYDKNTVGSYSLSFIARDYSGNETKVDFTFRVVDGIDNKSTEETKKKEFVDVANMYKKANVRMGIDVSQWQGEINWEKVKNAGVEFAIIRVGYQKDFDNRDYVVDPYFEKNIKGATKAGLDVGIYFASYAKTEEEGREQAEWVADKIKDYEVTLPVAFDWESWSSFMKCSMSFYDINHIAKTYINTLEEKGYQSCLYSSKYYLKRVWFRDDYESVWLAHYTTKTDYDGRYFMWQMCNTGRVDGINADVDIDILVK